MTLDPEPSRSVPVGSSFAGRIVHLRSPVLRLRYRHGVYIDLRGYPDWLPYASALVRVPPSPAGLTRDEARLVAVLTANRLLTGALAHGPAANEPAPGSRVPSTAGGPDQTPAGWTWAHLGTGRRLALVPTDLHAAFRHRGGVAGLRSTVAARGLLDGGALNRGPLNGGALNGGALNGGALGGGGPVRFRSVRTVAPDAVTKLERWLGLRLPDGYREFLLATNGGVAHAPAVHPDAGFLADQPLFELAAADRTRDLAHAWLWFADRFTPEYLAVGPVQGGLVAVKVRGAQAGSVWFWDDDDPRDDERYQPPVICRDLLVRCADDWPSFVDRLTTVPASLRRAADGALGTGRAELLTEPALGAALPRARRPAWLPARTG